jgi:GT2 family glycosyltransferase
LKLTELFQHLPIPARAKGELILGFAHSVAEASLRLETPKVSHRLVRRLLEPLGLFDARSYSATAKLDEDADHLGHYISHGDAAGLGPNALFDPHYYRSQLHGDRYAAMNSLLHYVYFGRFRGFSPTPWFDVQYYLARNKDVARAGIDPWRHFLEHGGREGRAPSPAFDAEFYLTRAPELARAGVNPLAHYLTVGRRKGLPPLPRDGGSATASAAKAAVTAPSDAEWAAIRPMASDAESTAIGPMTVDAESAAIAPMTVDAESAAIRPLACDPAVAFTAPVDIVVPIFRGEAETLRCLHSILRSDRSGPFELVVVNDCSPEARLVATVRALAKRFNFTLIENAQNRGFVHSVNLGMQRHPERDVVILNSDTEVFGDWLGRLHAAAHRRSDIGTVTPLSNNATICSYPAFNRDNDAPLELDSEALDALAATVNERTVVDLPTGVGFCMFVRRACLAQTGPFDEPAFGLGYGEENDFCLRAAQLGWSHVAAADVFVHHRGSVSFRAERSERVEHAARVLAQRHPHYDALVREFLAKDPLRPARRRLDVARLSSLKRERNVLLLSHSRGGGTEKHVREEVSRLRSSGWGVFRLRPAPADDQVRFAMPERDELLNLESFSLEHPEALIEVLRELAMTELDVHHLADLDERAPEWMSKLAARTKLRTVVDVHDYAAVCPRINLVDGEGMYCGEPDVAACNACLKKHGSDTGATDIERWRRRYASLFEVASEVHVPDADVQRRLTRYFPEIHFLVKPHEDVALFRDRLRKQQRNQQREHQQVQRGEEQRPQHQLRLHQREHQPLGQSAASAPNAGKRLRIVAIGGISRMKGYDVLASCAEDTVRRGLPLDFVLLGHSVDDARLGRLGVTVTGRYADDQAEALLAARAPHVCFLPALWPETYSYTLSLALRAGLPVFAFDLGAIPNRLAELNAHQHVMGLAMAREPALINDRFVQFLEARVRVE